MAAARTTSTSSTARTSRCRSSARWRPSRRRTTSRRSRRSRAARGRSTSIAPAVSRSTPSSKSGTNRFSGEVSLRVPGQQHGGGPATAGRSRGYEQDRSWFTVNARRPDHSGEAVLLRIVLPAGELAREPRQRLRRLPEYKRDAQRRLRQADVHAAQFGPGQRQLSRFPSPRRSATCSARSRRRRQGRATSSGRRSSAAEGSWIINDHSTSTFKFTRFGLETLGTSRQHRHGRAVERRSARGWTSPPSISWACSPCRRRSRTDGLQRVHPALHRPIRLCVRRRRRRPVAARSVSAASSTTRTSSANNGAGRLQRDFRQTG